MEKVIEWLLEGEPWVVYRTRLDLLGQSEHDKEVITARDAMVSDPKVKLLFDEIRNWPGVVLNSHKSAKNTYHILSFLADLGLNNTDKPIQVVLPLILSHQSEEGPFQLSMNIPKHFGGSGNDDWAWALCDAPVIVYALSKFGLGRNERVIQAADYLKDLVRDNGWTCVVSKELGKFRGPGKKNDPCPYATFIMLKMLREINPEKYAREIEIAANSLLQLWEKSKEQHPYMFFMGTDFRKLKAPNIWYDLLHFMDILSQVESVITDGRFREMADILRKKADADGKYTPESVYQVWKEWDFGQKKIPSRWITLMVLRILKRLK